MAQARVAVVLAAGCWALIRPAAGSQLHFRGMDEDAAEVRLLMTVKIVSVAQDKTVAKFPNRPEGVTTAVHRDYVGEVREVILGEHKATRVKFRRTFVVPVKYDDKGNEEFRFSLIVPGSGIEHDLKPGTEYVIGFSGVDADSGSAFLIRAEPLQRRAAFVAATVESACWRTAKAKAGAALEGASAVGFDGKGLLCVAVPRDGGTDVFLFDAHSMKRSRLEGPKRFNRIDFEPEKVRLRFNDGPPTHILVKSFSDER